MKDNKHNSLHLTLKICSDICPWILSFPQSSQFSLSFALKTVCPQTNVLAYFAANGSYCFLSPSSSSLIFVSHINTVTLPPISEHSKCETQVVDYENLDHIGSKFWLISIRLLKRLIPVLNALFSKKTSLRKNLVLPIEKFPSFILSRNTITLQHLIIQFSFNHRSVVAYRRLKANERNFQIFSSKSGHGRLRGWLLTRGLKYFGKLVAEKRWLQPEVSTVYLYIHDR